MRIKPYITSGLLAGVLALPIAALALGLGKLTVQSGLGQPLSASIELTAAQKDELDSLRARIADPSVYRDNSVQYPGALARARVSLEQGPNNIPYLKITSAQAVNDPYLDLIIELSWATGRVVRDYTFLLDPPGAVEMQAAVEPAPPLRAQAATGRPERQARRPAESAAAQGTTRRAAESSAAGPDTTAAGGTYTVKRGDTLSKIAGEYKPENVSLEQMLVALFRSNESAFDGRNMNRLRSGQIITIPQGDQIASLAQPEATQVVKMQAADWRAYRDRVAAGAPASDSTASSQAAGGKITTAVQDQASTAQPGKDQLRVSREAGKGAAAGAALAEDSTSKDKALRDANSRVAELEKTVRDLQRAAELRNQTLAELQARADAAAGKSPAPAKAEPPKVAAGKAEPAKTEAPKSSVNPPTAMAPAVTPPSTTAPVATAPVVSPPATAPSATPQAKAPETKAPDTTPAIAPVAKAPDVSSAPVVAPVAKAPDATPTAPATKTAAPAKKAAEPSFIDDLFGNTPTWAVGGGALVVLAGIAGLIAARRRKTTKFEDSIISGTDIKTNTVFGSTGGGVVNTGDNSLASDFSREGLGNIDTDEVDPIAEAEVYLAYGRDAQAEEILKDALKKDPQRQEIYLKLLEIHAQHNKPSAFETVASELYAVSGGQGEVWQKAMALGRQLDPTNPLFAEAGAAAFAATAASAKIDAPPSDTDVFSVPPEVKPEPPATTALDFTLDDEISLSPTSGVAEPKTPAAILAGAAEQVAKSSRAAPEAARGFSDSTISAAAMAGGAAGAAAGAAVARGESSVAKAHEPFSFDPESIPRFDLDFKLDEPSKPGPAIAKTVATAPAATTPEPALATAGSPAPQLARPAAAIELDKLDLAFDPQRSTFEDPTPSVLDGQWHDAATKLDLAKAYQEMGDVEGAREILQEVLHEGDDQQKTEAQGLLSKLA